MTRHLPVMPDEVLRYLDPAPGKVLADLTVGGGGHSRLLLEAGARVLGFDRDPEAIDRVRARFSSHADRFSAFHTDFAAFGGVLDQEGTAQVDGVLMDLGLSSDQLDDPTRGFAHRLDGPLDLRFDPGCGEPAWSRLESASASEIAGWLRELGEVRRPTRLARAMAARAAEKALRSTSALRELVLAHRPAHRRPAPELARVFQALRILVNDELTQLEQVLFELPRRLRPEGRLVVISYHSLEDRQVKRMLQRESGRATGGSRHRPPAHPAAATLRVLTRRVLRPSEQEIQKNPRARSARLRAGERLP